MATVVKAEISIKGKRLESFSHLSINQQINTPQHFEVICRPDAFDSFSMAGESLVLEKAKDLIGKKIKIDIKAIGKDNVEATSATVFNGIILEVSGSKFNDSYNGSISLKGSSMDVLLDSERHCRTFENLKLDDVVNRVLSDYSSNIFDGKNIQSNFSEMLPYTVQYNETNHDFITRLAKTYGEWFGVTGDNKLFFGEPPTTKVNLLHGKDLLEVTYAMKLATLGIEYKAYNYLKEETIKKNADALQVNAEGNLKKSMNISEDVLDHTEDIYYEVPNYNTSADKLVDYAVKTAKKERVSSLYTATGVSDNCEVFLGCVVKIDNTVFSKGQAKTLNTGEYRVFSIRHTCDEGGNYLNHFEAIPSSLEAPPGTDSLLYPKMGTQSAIVTDTNDPDGMGRVRVRFFWQEDGDQTPWLRIVTPYAGKNKGIFFIPEVEEEVLVGFENGHAEKPYVIGSHYTGKKKPDDWKGDKNHKKAIRTRSGHTIQFNDEDGKEDIVIYDKDKVNTITLSSHGKLLTIECKGDMKINAENIDITAESDYKLTVKGKIEITSQNDTVMKASGNFKAKTDKNMELSAMSDFKAKANSKAEVKGTTLITKGSATAELSGGVTTIVKGAVVKIN
jgi:uncharacterized protein involved in type VI secretion and phage assembly